ncbi:PaaI family thioesterase [Malonomonas rubra]|uniref:PaaI family thioesterase n=1 Tax=Malonomonas rubra TaxID=57040 RepID=UPI0026EF3ABF|nr:PaaI family thioesterase [Malonomonas rubra]
MSEAAKQEVEADSGCFVCGPKNLIGLQADFTTDNSQGASYAVLQLSSDYQGWKGVIHGGIIASLLDEACIYACRAKADRCVTAELQVRYRKPVPVEAQVVVTGRLEDCSRKVWQASAQLKIDDSLYAEATAKVFVLDR